MIDWFLLFKNVVTTIQPQIGMMEYADHRMVIAIVDLVFMLSVVDVKVRPNLRYEKQWAYFRWNLQSLLPGKLAQNDLSCVYVPLNTNQSIFSFARHFIGRISLMKMWITMGVRVQLLVIKICVALTKTHIQPSVVLKMQAVCQWYHIWSLLPAKSQFKPILVNCIDRFTYENNLTTTSIYVVTLFMGDLLCECKF